MAAPKRSRRKLDGWTGALVLALGLAAPGALAALPALFHTDWTVRPGAVWSSQLGAEEHEIFRAPQGNVSAAAFAPDGTLYYVDANRFDILRWSGSEPVLVHRHSTYVRDVAFDRHGRLHFSEAFGAGKDGQIFYLNDLNQPRKLQDVRLTDVGGYWSGHFTFDNTGRLYLSTGNRVGSKIFQVLDGRPQVIHEEPAEPIAGIVFDQDGTLYWANWGQRIYRLPPGGTRSVFREDPARRFADVTLPPLASGTLAFGPEAGRVNSLTTHPSNSSVVFAGTSSGGVFASVDGGQTWSRSSRGITHFQIGSVLFDPRDPTRLLAATPAGVFVSTNFGREWNKTLTVPWAPAPPDAGNMMLSWQRSPLAYDPTDNSFYAAPLCGGLFQSTNSGQSWSKLWDGLGSLGKCFLDLEISAGEATLYTASPAGLWRRTAGGPWTQVTTGSSLVPVSIANSPSSSGRLYVAHAELGSGSPAWSLMRRDTVNGGFQQANLPPTRNDYFFPELLVHPGNPDQIWLGGLVLATSSNGGFVWSDAICNNSTICGVDYRGMALDHLSIGLFAGHDQGIFRYVPDPPGFAAVEKGLVNTQFYDIEVGRGGTLYGGTQDTGFFRRSNGSWESPSVGGTGDVLDLLVDPRDENHLFVSTNTGLYFTGNGGSNFHKSAGVPTTNFWNHQIVYIPGASRLFLATRWEGVVRSDDDGKSFQSAGNNGLPREAIRCLEAQPGSSGSVLYAGTLQQGVWKSGDEGRTWQRLASFPEEGALVLRHDPRGAPLYAGTAKGMYTSSDGGRTWSEKRLAGVVSEILIDPACPCRLYAGRGFYSGFGLYGGGVWQSSDRGVSWSPLSSQDDAPLNVTSLAFDPTDPARLWVGTYGSGVRLLFRNASVRGCRC